MMYGRDQFRKIPRLTIIIISITDVIYKIRAIYEWYKNCMRRITKRAYYLYVINILKFDVCIIISILLLY